MTIENKKDWLFIASSMLAGAALLLGIGCSDERPTGPSVEPTPSPNESERVDQRESSDEGPSPDETKDRKDAETSTDTPKHDEETKKRDDARDDTSPVFSVGTSLSPDAGRAPLEVQFSVNVTGEESSASFEYQWDFDDQSQTVNKQRPTHVYNTPGTYEPKVKVIRQSDGASVTAQTVPRSITVLDEEDYQLEIRTIGLKSDKVPPRTRVGFICHEMPSEPDAAYTWWVDGQQVESTEKILTRSFDSEGQFEVKCRAEIPTAETLTDSLNVSVDTSAEVVPLRVYSLNVNPTQGPAPLNIEAQVSYSYDRSGKPTFRWTFDDSRQAVTETARVTRTYRKKGTYNVNVRVQGEKYIQTREQRVVVSGNQLRTEIRIDENETDSSTMTPRTVGFVCETPSGAENATYRWSFGDGNVRDTSENHVVHIYRSAPENGDTYNASCQVIAADGETGRDTVDVGVVEQTIDSISMSLDESKTDDSLTATRQVGLECSVTGGNPPFEVEWDYDNGTTQPIGGLDKRTFTQTFDYTDPSGSPYRPSCTVTDSTGASRTATLGEPIEVREDTQPTIQTLEYFPKQPGVGETVDFRSTVTGGNTVTGPYEYRWRFGDGDTDQGSANVAHTYDSTGTYDVELRVSDTDGDIVSETVQVTVTE